MSIRLVVPEKRKRKNTDNDRWRISIMIDVPTI